MVPAGDSVCGAAVGCQHLAVHYRPGLCAMLAFFGPRRYLGEAKVLVVQADDASVSRGATVSPLLGLCLPGTRWVSFDLMLAQEKV